MSCGEAEICRGFFSGLVLIWSFLDSLPPWKAYLENCLKKNTQFIILNEKLFT